MPVFRIPPRHLFPDPELADPEGLLGVGGDLDPDRVLLAYRNGIFPWYSAEQPILWWSPDPRMVLPTEALHLPKSLAKRLRKGDLRCTMDQRFGDVITACATVPRPGQDGTWITPELVQSFIELHRRGHAHSVECWQEDRLVGGLYGISVGRLFCGESMFADVSDASKVAFVRLVQQLQRWDVPLVDCQVHTDHLARFGATEVPRTEFLTKMRTLVGQPGRLGPWRLDADLQGGRP